MLTLSESMKVHTREAYTLLGIFEEIGGLSEIIFLLGFVIIAPIAEHGYVLRAISKFYLVKEST